ncbi:hypothetical protein LZ30DRAFT_605584, partial [Colletotrichum cereale]
DNSRGLEGNMLPRYNRKKPYRINNREAARRCHNKIRQYKLNLVAIDQQVTKHQTYLKVYVSTLKEEVLNLKNKILQHSNCNYKTIKRYITKAASDVSLGTKNAAQGSWAV